jgi:murein DD-endopeptidase MepM/ murein hydrolase activator NlpD
VKAAENGTVIYSGAELQDFGKLILVSHANGWVSAYAHSSANLVKRGDKVSRGQVIARSGRSGNANVPKLHFELRKNSNPVDPLKHLTR